jgi:tetratricopeptide (TPR) repeat protein
MSCCGRLEEFMNDKARPAQVLLAPEQRERIFKLYNAGLYLQAYRFAEAIGPLRNWRGTEARVLAGRMAGNLGSGRMSNWHFVHAWRSDRANPEAMWFFARYLLGAQGPLAAWNFVRAHEFPSHAPNELQSHWCSQHAAILGFLRDFDAADQWLAKAEAIGVQAWTCLERAGLYSLEDRHDEAESAARRALELHPWYRPAVQWVAHFLLQKERDQEALELLTQATTRLESSALFCQLASLQIELQRYDDALASLDNAERTAPLMDKSLKQWLDARRCDLACHKGYYGKAIEYARNAAVAARRQFASAETGIKFKFYENLAKILESKTSEVSRTSDISGSDQNAQPGEGYCKRVVIPVGYIRQHHRTCAPATMVSIANFWRMPADHLEIAAEISYAGTPHYSQRKWAHDHGWFTKEFTLTWDSAVALIDRGIPFTLTTCEVTSAHLQAVIGYDGLRRTLIIRDPGDRHKVEIAFDAMLQRYRSSGPRAMAMVPGAQKENLESLPLPDENLYDQLHRLELALKDHRRDEAGRIAEALLLREQESWAHHTHGSDAPAWECVASDAPGVPTQERGNELADSRGNELADSLTTLPHFLALTAKRALAIYDTDLPEELNCTEQLLQLFPDDLQLGFARTNLLSVLGRYSQRLEILQTMAQKGQSDPACWQQYALELSADARQHPQALYLLRRAIRANPMLARAYTTLARIRSAQRKFEVALQLYHFAAALEEKDEFIAQDYFFEARAQGKTEQAMQFLQSRFERLGLQSGHPARTLYFAHLQQGRYADAFNVLQRALTMRPDDGELLTYAAEAHMHLGDFAKAEEILEQAKGVSKPAARLRSLAYLAANEGNPALARQRWGEVLEIEPIAEDAHRNYCQLLTQMEGREASVHHLEAVCRRFVHHFNLNRMLYDALYEDGPAARERALKKLMEIHPADAWTRREYGLNLAEQGRLDEGFQQLDEAQTLEPNAPSLWSSRGFLYKKAKSIEDAKHAHREALRNFIDFDSSIFELFWLCFNLQERRDTLAFVEKELVRQATFGSGIMALRDAALTGIPPEELLGSLRRVLRVRPELWQAWSVVVRQLVYIEQGSEALDLAEEASQRFPLVAATWLDLAEAQRARNYTLADGGVSPREIDALQRSIQLAPAWDVPRKWLVDAHERSNEPAQAKAVLEKAIAHGPLVGGTYVDFAEFLWRQNEHNQAITQIRHALHLDPGLDPAWNDLCNWCSRLGRYDEVLEMARGWTTMRPGEARSWLRLGQALHWQSPQGEGSDSENQRVAQCAAAYDEALKRNPIAINIHDLKAEALALASRYDEASKACNPPFWKSKPPLELRGRAAWIKAIQGDYDNAKKQMCALLREDLDYQWGWNELVGWSQSSGQYREYQDAANDMLRTRPQSALAIAYRGEALVRMDERDTGLEDLRAAQRKDPCNSLAGFLLFDEQMNDENLVGAEATLLSLAQNIGGDFVKARQVQYYAKRENQTLALKKFKELASPSPLALRHLPRTTWPLDIALRALDIAGWREPAEQILLGAMKAPCWDTYLALLYARMWNPNKPNDLPDRIDVIERALERLPGDFRFLDLKAELLASGHQFERAREACKQHTYPLDQHALDGRSAWVMYRSGRQAEAITAMRELVKQHPKYFWGWMQLADWYAQSASKGGKPPGWVDVLTVAEQMVVLAPRDPTGYGYRGQAKENLGDPQAARADYIHALDLQPSYVFAAWSLFNIYVRNSEWQRAEKILDKVKKYSEPAEWALRKVDSLIYQNKKKQFAAEFENLCRKSAKSPRLIDQSLQYIVQAGWWGDAQEVLKRCLDLGPHMCDPWVRLRLAMGDRTVGDDVQNMETSPPQRSASTGMAAGGGSARTNCIAAYAIELAWAKDSAGLRRWLNAHAECLREDTACWAKAANALGIVQDWQGVTEWMSDWGEHPKALPGMLLVLIKAQRALGQIEDARQVGLHALTKLNPDYASSFHKVWLMFDEAMTGDMEAVQHYLEQSDLGGFDGYHQLIAALVRALWLTTCDQEAGFARGREYLAAAARNAPPTTHDPALSKSYQQCIGKMARRRGTLGAKVWRWWRWLVPILPAVQKMSS